MSASEVGTPIDCTAFEAHVPDYLEQVLDASRQSLMDAHAGRCASCAQLLADLQVIQANAQTLPLLSPSRDLWPDIASRLGTPVVTLDAGRDLLPVADVRVVGRRRINESRFMSVGMLAAAAVLLMAVSSGVTWVVSQRQKSAQVPVAVANPAAGSNASAPVAAAPVPATHPDSPAVASVTSGGDSRTAASVVRQASRATGSVDAVYEREIRSLRRIVDERMGDLDSATVVEIERNLAIIDKAIADSRRALERDPRSRFLTTQLDRALENKLAILRRVALL